MPVSNMKLKGLPYITRPVRLWTRSNSDFAYLNTTTTSVLVTTLPTTVTTFVATSTFSATSQPGLIQCPNLWGDDSHSNSSRTNRTPNVDTTSNNVRNIHFNTSDSRTGTIVKAECVTTEDSQTVAYLQCQGDGQWNGTLPDCVERLDFSSLNLYLAIGGGVSCLSIIVLFVLFCYLMTSRKRKCVSSSESSGESEKNIYADPYYVSDVVSNSSTASKFYARSDITYAKPVVYSTYLNPSFSEDAYDSWKRQEQNVSERLYDSPWTKPRGHDSQLEAADFQWSQTSIQTLGDSGFRKLPRAQLSIDHTSIKSNDTIGPASIAGLRDPLINQSTAATHNHPIALKRYPALATKYNNPETLSTLTGVTPDEKNNSSTWIGSDVESSDGLTNF